jgi:glucosamine-6-phosphate deaminase
MTSRLGRTEAPGAPAAPARGREGPERIPVEISETHEAIARAIAGRIATIVRERHAAGGAVLGLATGSTPIGIYRELIRLHRDEGLDFSRVRTFNLDEYYPIARTACTLSSASCARTCSST